MAGSSELEAVFLVILLHKADEGALVARGHPARVIEEPRFEVVMQRMKIPAAIVLEMCIRDRSIFKMASSNAPAARGVEGRPLT